MTVPFILGGFAVGLVVFLWVTGPWRRDRKARARPTDSTSWIDLDKPYDLDKLYGFDKSTTFVVPPSEGLRNVHTFGGDQAETVRQDEGDMNDFFDETKPYVAILMAGSQEVGCVAVIPGERLPTLYCKITAQVDRWRVEQGGHVGFVPVDPNALREKFSRRPTTTFFQGDQIDFPDGPLFMRGESNRDARGRFLKGGNPARDEKGRFV